MNPLMNYSPQPPKNDFMTRLQEFSRMVNGNPEQIVRSLIFNGQMSEQQFQQYAQTANQILGRRNG